MMIKTPITRKRIRDHFAYSFWKYGLLVVLSIFGWNLIYSVTAYRPPRDKKVDTYLVTYAMGEGSLDTLTEMATPAFPDMEALTFLHIALTTDDDYYANMQLSTYIGAQEGDVFLLPTGRFTTYANGGMFISLDTAIAEGLIDTKGIDASAGYLNMGDVEGDAEATAEGIFAIPASDLYGLMALGIDNRDLWIGVTAYSQNRENAIKMVNWLIETFKADKPEWVAQQEAASPQPSQNEVLPSY